jgi:hypothetical protein
LAPVTSIAIAWHLENAHAAATTPIPTGIDARVAAAIVVIGLFMRLCGSGKLGTSRFLPAGFHAHFILGLAGRAGIIPHAGPLLVAAYFAA